MPFARGEGARLYWRLDGDPAQPPILLLGSIGADMSLWDRLTPLLTPRYRVLRMDARGHGASDAPDGDEDLETLVDDALAVMDAAGVARAAVCGLSLGGMVAMALALKAPGRVSSLICACTSPRMDPGGGFIGADLEDRLGGIAAPTLVLCGARDVRAPFAGHGERLLAAIPGARIATLDTGHLACLEDPSGFADRVIGFLRDVADGGAVRAAEDTLFEAGLVNRREMLGDDWVDRSLAARTPFNADFQAMITRYAWREIWGRPGLDHRTRRLLVVATTAALGRWEEFRLHVRAGLTRGGFTQEELKEVLMQTAIYAGVPAANTAFAEAAKVIAEIAGQSKA